MKVGNRASLTAIPRKTATVQFTEYDTEYRLREMSGTDRDKFEIAAFDLDGEGKRKVNALHLRARMVALCLVDENNVRLYADDEVHMLSDESCGRRWSGGCLSPRRGSMASMPGQRSVPQKTPWAARPPLRLPPSVGARHDGRRTA
ncbi:MAG: hypothetical protein IPH55_17100 [Betaproteobacteria bacterium]|nr:hypothetical protein [Betaproteobacteria bacterium]